MKEEFDPEFCQWIEDFSRDQLPEIHHLLEQYGEGGKCMFSTAGLKQMTGCGHSREYEKRRGIAPLLFIAPSG